MSGRFLTRPAVEATATIQLTEVEMRALEAMTGYGIKAFMEFFYKHMGEHYMKPHEKGMISFMESVQCEIPSILRRIDKARKAFNPPITEEQEGQP